ncbi:MAG: hypothetical protein PHD32_01190 [Eubacteriales bacterium]|nr:hypothetical protein [Eubacteriales bacterium]
MILRDLLRLGTLRFGRLRRSVGMCPRRCWRPACVGWGGRSSTRAAQAKQKTRTGMCPSLFFVHEPCFALGYVLSSRPENCASFSRA